MLQTLNNLAGKISPSSGGGLAPTDCQPKMSHNNNNNSAVNNNNNNDSYHKPLDDNNGMPGCQDQPDPDFIKMFVGQVPRSMDEADLTKMFSEYGRVHQINVLRDKLSGQSKGCCFVTFYTRKAALDAQNALHNIKVLPGMHHPIQMKPADSENRNERKLFVGMISKKYSETDVRQMFEGFGTIEECSVLRDTSGQSKGCAFVTFTSKQCAINAIKAMHHSKTIEGCSLPLVVKFADTQKEKDQKRLHQMQANLWNLSGMSLSPQSYLNQTALLQQLQANTSPTSLGTQLLLQNSSAAAAGLHNIASLNSSTSNLSEISSANLQNLAALANLSAVHGVSPMHMQNLVALAAMGAANSVSSNGHVGLSGQSLTDIRNDYFWLNDPKRQYIPKTTDPSLYYQPVASLSGIGTSAAAGGSIGALNSLTSYAPPSLSVPDAYQRFAAAAAAAAAASSSQATSPAGLQIEGPEGANLFIYHLPPEFTDSDLVATFQPFGNVISAKVFIDRLTNISKCFGFVSYDNTVSAQSAIQSMNGFQIGTKRLKVQPKRPKEASRPY